MGASLDRTATSPSGAELVDLLLGRVPAAFALFDCDLNYICCSDRWHSDFRIREADLRGKSFFDLFPGKRETLRDMQAAVIEGRTVSHPPEPLKKAMGAFDRTRWSMSPVIDEAGRVTHIFVTADVPTRPLANYPDARLLREEFSLFSDFDECTAICMLDEQGEVAVWNAGAQRVFGWSEVEALGLPFAAMFAADDGATGMLASAQAKGICRDQLQCLRKDGSRFPADVTIRWIEGNGPLPGGFGQIVRDLTFEHSQTDLLAASADLLRSILETVADAMIVIDENGQIISFSSAAQRLFGYDEKEVVGRNVSMLMPQPERREHDSYLARYRSTGTPHIIGSYRRVMGQRKDGAIFPLELRVGEASGGDRRLFAGFLHDLSASEATEARLSETQNELAHLARLSDMGTLATAIAHDLNQPLMAIGNIVQTCAELIRSSAPADPDMLASALEDAGEQALRAGEIIKRLRSFLSRGELEHTVESPVALTRQACELATRDAIFRQIDWTIHASEDLPAILVDRVQIQQVLINLIRNAVEAIGSNGKIVIAIERIDDDVRFGVTDDGPGVAEDRIDSLFQPFLTSKPTGMGLGLAISRTIAETHGGALWHERVASGGARFLFTVPAFGEEKLDDG